MENMKSITEFPITVYGKIEQYTDTISSARCRIFYKGLNRNGTYISKTFAEDLVKTLPYTPIKGIYDEFMDDFKGHGKERTEGRIYGIVPETNNFAWEKFVDEDGVEREYACCDVYLFTGLYAEARDIVGKSQSMELYLPSIKGDWEFVDGERCYVYTAGSFLGLQVLGDEVEPCFEGAAFFELVNKLESALKQIEKFNFANQQGGNEMPELTFKLSDERFAKLWDLLNAVCGDEEDPKKEELSEGACGDKKKDYECGYQICGIFDDYALAYNLETSSFERVYFEENEDGMFIKEKQGCHVLEVTEHELEVLNTLRDGSYENIAEKFEELNGKFEEQVQSFSTLNVENEELKNNYEKLNETYEQLKNEFELLKSENESLTSYKLEKETQEKNEIIDKYSNELDEEVLNAYRAKTSEFSHIELEKELAYELVQSKPTIFSQAQVRIPNDVTVIENNDLTSILEKYRKNGGK